MKPEPELVDIDRVELVMDLRTLRSSTDNPPSISTYKEAGEYPLSAFYNEFESWNEALTEAGFEQRHPRGKYPFELLDEIRRVYEEGIDDLAETDGYMRFKDYVQGGGEYVDSVFYKQFNSWMDALSAAGLKDIPKEDDRGKRDYSDEDLLDTIRDVADEIGRTPPYNKFNELTPDDAPTVQTINYRFGSWDSAVEEAGLEPYDETDTLTKEDFIKELKRLADDLDRVPTTGDLRKHGNYSTTALYERFDTWGEALEASGLD